MLCEQNMVPYCLNPCTLENNSTGGKELLRPENWYSIKLQSSTVRQQSFYPLCVSVHCFHTERCILLRRSSLESSKDQIKAIIWFSNCWALHWKIPFLRLPLSPRKSRLQNRSSLPRASLLRRCLGQVPLTHHPAQGPASPGCHLSRWGWFSSWGQVSKLNAIVKTKDVRESIIINI